MLLLHILNVIFKEFLIDFFKHHQIHGVAIENLHQIKLTD